MSRPESLPPRHIWRAAIASLRMFGRVSPNLPLIEAEAQLQRLRASKRRALALMKKLPATVWQLPLNWHVHTPLLLRCAVVDEIDQPSKEQERDQAAAVSRLRAAASALARVPDIGLVGALCRVHASPSLSAETRERVDHALATLEHGLPFDPDSFVINAAWHLGGRAALVESGGEVGFQQWKRYDVTCKNVLGFLHQAGISLADLLRAAADAYEHRPVKPWGSRPSLALASGGRFGSVALPSEADRLVAYRERYIRVGGFFQEVLGRPHWSIAEEVMTALNGAAPPDADLASWQSTAKKRRSKGGKNRKTPKKIPSEVGG